MKFPRKEEEKLTPKQFAAITFILDENSQKVEVSKWVALFAKFVNPKKKEDILIKNPFSSLSALNVGEVLYQAGQLEVCISFLLVNF